MNTVTRVTRLVLWEVAEACIRDVIECDASKIAFAVETAEEMLTGTHPSSKPTVDTRVDLELIEHRDDGNGQTIRYMQHDGTLLMATPPRCRKPRPMVREVGDQLIEVRKILTDWFATKEDPAVGRADERFGVSIGRAGRSSTSARSLLASLEGTLKTFLLEERREAFETMANAPANRGPGWLGR